MKRTLSTELISDIHDSLHCNYIGDILINVKDLLYWHSTKKAYYKDWMNSTYLKRLLERTKSHNIDAYTTTKHGMFVPQIYHTKNMISSIEIVEKIVPLLPSIKFILMDPCNINDVFSIKTRLGVLFTVTKEVKHLDISQHRCIIMVNNLLVVRYGWMLVLKDNNKYIELQRTTPIPIDAILYVIVNGRFNK